MPNNVEPNDIVVQYKFIDRGNPLWVLSLSGDDWLAPTLKLGNTADVEVFYNHIAPIIRRRRRRPPPRVKKDDPETPTTMQPTRSNNDIKKEFIKIINKLVLTTTTEPDAYITDNTHDYDSNPSLALYKKGPYVCLVVELGNKQWHYFISTPSTLPEWFYESHDTRESPILIPEDVTHQLFSALLRILHALFGFPV